MTDTPLTTNRRQFLELGVTGGAALALSGCLSNVMHPHLAAKPPNDLGHDRSALKKEYLRNLLAQYRAELFDEFLPFMDQHVIDHQYGGFMCNCDVSGSHINENKYIWYEGRGIWVYSFLYEHVKSDPSYLEIARKSLEFVMKHKPKDDRLWPTFYSREGKVLNDPQDRIYGDVFVAEGMIQYARAAKAPEYLNLAMDIIRKCIGIYDKPDYYPASGNDYITENGSFVTEKIPSTPGARMVGHWMVILRCATQILYTKPNEAEALAWANRSIDAINNHHYNPEYGMVNELLNHDLSRMNNLFSRHCCTGHAIETFWIMMDEAVRRKDEVLFKLAADRFERHVKVSFDDVFDGVFYSLDDIDRYLWKTQKIMWAQLEVLNGTMLLYRYTGDGWAGEMAAHTHRYVESKFSQKQYGYPLWILSSDRKVKFDPKNDRIENYHIPRQLMQNMLVIEELIKYNGQTRNPFSAD